MAEELTVIVVALLGGQALDDCLSAVGAQAPNCLAVGRDGTIVDAEGRTVGIADGLDIPAKRRCGVELASTPLVALLEDTAVPASGWADAVTRALSEKDVVGCGGPVIAGEGLPPKTQALILSEYGRYDDSRTAGEVSSLPGCNFAFRRNALLEAMRDSHGLVDLAVFSRLQVSGGKLAWAPAMAVTFSQPYPDGARLSTRFAHGRIYASANTGPSRRAAAAAKALLLPIVLTARALKQPRPRRRLGSIATLSWLVLQHSAWAAGEFIGALAGPSNKGLNEWR